MNYRSEDLKKLRKNEMEILKEIIRICEDNGLIYFTVGGTTLGTIRHEGFIPWDDDIDIGMMREDYESFLEIAPNQLKQGYSLQHFTADPNTPTYFAKVRKDGTKFVEKNFAHIQMHHGIFVDIIPFDAVPEDGKERKWDTLKAKICFQLYACKSLWTTAEHIVPKRRKRYMVNTIRSILHILLLPVRKEYLYKLLNNVLCKYNATGTKMISDCTRNIPACSIEDYYPVQMRKFEDMQIAVPRHYDKVLKAQFGDYMQLPPVEKRKSHTPVELDFGENNK